MTKKPNQILHPHDRFFRSIMTHPHASREFFDLYLPDPVKKCIDLSSLKLQSESFIDDKLNLQIADVLHTVNFNGKPGYIYLLIEHASSPHKLLPFRLLKYMIAIMEKHLKVEKTETLPVVYPLILYSGKLIYPYSTDLFELFDAQQELAREFLLSAYKIVDLKRLDDEEYFDHYWFGVAAYVSKYRELMKPADLIVQIVDKLQYIVDNNGVDYATTIIRYSSLWLEPKDRDEYCKALSQLEVSKEGKKMDFVEMIMQEGMQEGMQKGIFKGKLEGIEEGLHKGIHEQACESAQRCFEMGLSLEQSSIITGLAQSELINLKKQWMLKRA